MANSALPDVMQVKQAIQLSLGAAPQVRLADGSRVPLGPRDGALLAWLALEGPTPRARLAQLLWPESEPESARNALRQRLFQLKKLLGVDVVSGGATLALAEGLAHDLAESDSVLGEGTHDFGPELAAWLAQQRERRRGRLRQSLIELSDMAAQARDYADALSHANELLTLEPLSEEAHRRVMQLHYLAGDRAAALLAFDRCEQVLKDEVGATPSPETMALLATLEQPSKLRGSADGASVPASVLRPPHLIGRDADLAELEHGWHAGQVVAVFGEAGLGKSRLLQAFAETRTGVVVVSARPGDGGVPFALLARLLRAVIGREPGRLQVLDSGLRNEVARVLPEVEPALATGPGEGQRLAMRRAVLALLNSCEFLSGLLVDDLHFADEASLEMLLALIDGSSVGLQPLHWVLASRPAEVGSSVQTMLDALTEQARLRPLRLLPLSEAALAELVDSLGLPGIQGALLAPALRQRTGGNPLFVLETLKQAWVERTLEQLADGAVLPRPVSVGRLIERRIAQVSPGALALARVASVAGVDFSIALAEHVLGTSAVRFADALNELESAQILRGTQFAHDLVFDAVYQSVPGAIAQHLHGGVAAWLEGHGGEPARIAQHWIEAGQPRPALPWLQQAADKARSAARVKEYFGFLERKSAIEEQLGEPAEAFETLLPAVKEFINVDREGAPGLLLCDRLDRLAGTSVQRIEAWLQRSTHCRSNDLSGGVEFARRALHESQRIGDARLSALSHQTLGTALFCVDRLTEAVEHFAASLSWIDAQGSVEERCELHGNLANLYVNMGRLDDSMPHHERAIELAQACGNQGHLAAALSNLACCCIDAGDLVAAGEHLLRSLQVMVLHDDFDASRGTNYLLLALCSCQLGRYREALAHAEQAIELTVRDTVPHVAVANLRQAGCWRALGQWGRVQQILELPVVRESTLAMVHAHSAILQHHLDIALGRPPGGDVVRALIGVGAERPDLRLLLQIEQAQTLPLDEALPLLEQVCEQALAMQYEGTAMAARVRAAGLCAGTDPAAAVRHAEAALALAARCQSISLVPAELWLHAARAFQAAGDSRRADELLALGRNWIRDTAREHVPEAFRDSFLHRNPVNRELLALAAQR